tara:strand:+ start:152 stop:670 length:519 start_codon:yes stop_codon:yes gene_type:complete
LEELIYWGIIFLFYLFSAYRSRQKKVEGEQVQVPDPLPQTQSKTSKTDFNIFEFLDESMEKSAIELDDSLTSNFVEPLKDDSPISRQSKQSVQASYTEVDDLNKDNYKQNSKSFYNIKDKHLSHLKSRITTKQVDSHSEQRLLKLQQKLKNKPTKLAIVMQAIFDPPKSQGI